MGTHVVISVGAANITPETPLRLSVAAKIAFPDGSMTVSGLRREAGRGRLIIEQIAGKHYTTLANIERMRELCRVRPKVHESGYDHRDETKPVKPCGSSSTATDRSPHDALRAKLQRRKANSQRI